MKTVIFLGAGASKAEGAPLQRDLLQEYFKMRIEKNKMEVRDYGLQENDVDYRMEQKVKRYFYDMFGIDRCNPLPTGTVFPTYEEVLGMIDLADMRNEKFYRQDNTFNYNSLEVRDNDRISLVLLMAETIKYTLENSKSDPYHQYLVEYLVNGNKMQDIAFISTNYDILVDNAIENPGGLNIDYGIDLYNNIATNNIPLYKIHGSLNWLYCPVCKTTKITRGEKGATYLIDGRLREAKCLKCNSLCEAVIVPPTYYKNMNNPCLNLVWNKTEEELTHTEHIIFCGYSFPDADIHIKYLLKRAELIKTYRARLKITIINNHDGKTQVQKDEEYNRFKRFFTKETDVRQSNLSFQEFALNPFSIL